MKSLRRCNGRNAFTLAAFAIMLFMLGGCATFSADAGRNAVQTLANERIGSQATLPVTGPDNGSAASATREILAKPLGADDAVQMALLNNAQLKSSLAELGIAEADLVQAARLRNPTFSYSNRRSSDATTIDRTVMLNVVAMLTMPLAQKVAARQFEAAQLQAASDVLQLAYETRRAYFAAVAAQQSQTYFEQVMTAAEASAELAEKLAAAGNFSKLAQMREQAFRADATTQLAKARLAAAVERERLTRLLGVSASDLRYQLQERLPELPATSIEALDAERAALERRLDVQIAKRSTEALAANLGLTRATRFINVLEAGYTNESNTGEKRQNGYEIEVEVPLFDWGDAKLARAEATYMQSVHRTAAIAQVAQSDVRAAYQTYRTAYDVARHYRDEVVPLRKRIADENVLRYNAMLISVFELLEAARAQIASVNNSVEALRDFWIADTDLQLAQNGASAGGRVPSRTAATPTASAAGAH
ncbi:MAG TPA: TolC family protein [Casimicrobiaceae bacterium]